MTEQRDRAVTAVHGLLWRGGHLLMLHRPRTNFREVPEWALITGQVENGEKPKKALIRELDEEVGVEADEEDLHLVHTQYRTGYDQEGARVDARVDFYYGVTRYRGEVTNKEPHNHDKIEWFGPRNLPPDIMPHILHALDAIARGEEYSELDIDWLRSHKYAPVPIPIPIVEAQEGGP